MYTMVTCYRRVPFIYKGFCVSVNKQNKQVCLNKFLLNKLTNKGFASRL